VEPVRRVSLQVLRRRRRRIPLTPLALLLLAAVVLTPKLDGQDVLQLVAAVTPSAGILQSS
jgi:hypothetical protein